MSRWFLSLFALMMASQLSADGVREANSPEHRVAVLELYTSEGCSSCPPADRFVSRLHASDSSSQRVIPLAFHVTYWDYIGWQDRFGQALFDQRQRQLGRSNRLSTIYTPQFVLGGRDFRLHRGFNDKVASINAEPAEVDLTLAVSTAANHVDIRLDMTASRSGVDDIALFVAVVENGLQSTVDAGENEGETLHHDAVVRVLHGPEFVSRPATQGQLQKKLLLPADWNSSQVSIVGFAQDLEHGDVLQAVRLPLQADKVSALEQ